MDRIMSLDLAGIISAMNVKGTAAGQAMLNNSNLHIRTKIVHTSYRVIKVINIDSKPNCTYQSDVRNLKTAKLMRFGMNPAVTPNIPASSAAYITTILRPRVSTR